MERDSCKPLKRIAIFPLSRNQCYREQAKLTNCSTSASSLFSSVENDTLTSSSRVEREERGEARNAYSRSVLDDS